jgi:hypothetical protein
MQKFEQTPIIVPRGLCQKYLIHLTNDQLKNFADDLLVLIFLVDPCTLRSADIGRQDLVVELIYSLCILNM